MKTLLYNPIFINPQAYYVFPRLTRYLQPDNESTSEPANYIGTIEVKVIAYGDTTLKRTYTNTDSIDLSEFKNTWIRISLFTKVGSCVLGEWKIGNMESDLPYIDPEVLASLKAVVIVGNKTNNDSDRAIVKNLVDPDNPFVISNAAFKLNSGFGKYSADFESFDWAVNISQKQHNKATISLNGRLCNHAAIEVDEMKVNIIGNVTELIYWYIANPDDTTRSEIRLTSGINTLPKSYAKDDGQTYNIGFAYISGDSEITIEQIPSFEGAFVTDGINDLITSTKTVQEMLGGSNEFTVVSMIANLDSVQMMCNSNYNNTNGYNPRNTLEPNGVISMLGYTDKNGTTNNLNLIMGDKDSIKLVDKVNFNSDYVFYPAQYYGSYYKAAWYWTVIANKVLTTDEINQVIAYFNLDRTLNPDILCDIEKQGITNENHAEFGDKLIDFSGNGRDIQLNNIAWKGDSGIGKYEVDFLDSSIWNSSNSTITSSKIDCKNAISHIMLLYYSVGSKEYPDIPSFKVIKTGADIDYSYIDETGSPKSVRIVDGVNVLPASHNTLYSGSGRFCGFGNPGMGNSVTITQIPSHAGGLCLDGVNDFGKVTGMPVYKDYTFIIDYERISYASSERWVAGVVSKSHVANQGAFILMTANTEVEPGKQAYSFGGVTSFNRDDFTRALLYQSKYKCGDVDLTVGEGVDSDTLWLGTFRDNDQRFFNGAIYSLMSFPYSMSEFLIERQLKKHKLGTLYPDMVEFRPIIKANNDYEIVYTAIIKPDNWQEISVGDYVTVGESVAIQIKLNNPLEVTNVSSNSLADISFYKEENSDNIYTIYGRVLDGKSPQKITIDIQVDSSLVQWNPVVESTAEYSGIGYLNYSHNLATINVGDYISIGDIVAIRVILDNTVDEIVNCKVNGQECEIVNVSPRIFDCKFTLTSESPQNINITIDEYIRYEDIVQPYPVLLRFNDENGNEVSWGGKFKVGSNITRIGSIADPESNLLNGLYSISGLSLNGKAVTSSTSIVEKQMVFRTTATWLLDNNEPKCILSPRLLRIPNSSYKILGYIPDISGHGNHGKINNSAYKLNSGVNGYLVDFTTLKDDGIKGIVRTDSKIYLDKSFNYNQGFWLGRTNNPSPAYKVKVSGIPKTGMLTYTGGVWLNLVNGINELPARTNTEEEHGFVIQSPNLDWSNLVIEQIGEYEGAYCLDGVDDSVTIPTTVGGKQVLMKVNWDSPNASILYDQRGYDNEFAIYNGTNDSDGNPIPAYQGRNNGQTYIDGILNSNIKALELRAITHNITITNELSSGANKTYPIIGSSKSNAYFVNMALYDFMLFDEISTDDKIKELNEYVGIEGNTDDLFNETN